jgi:hypothetical protein
MFVEKGTHMWNDPSSEAVPAEASRAPKACASQAAKSIAGRVPLVEEFK